MHKWSIGATLSLIYVCHSQLLTFFYGNHSTSTKGTVWVPPSRTQARRTQRIGSNSVRKFLAVISTHAKMDPDKCALQLAMRADFLLSPAHLWNDSWLQKHMDEWYWIPCDAILQRIGVLGTISSQSVTNLLVALEKYSYTTEVNSNRVLLRPAWAIISRITFRCVPFSIRPSYFGKLFLAKGQRLERELVITPPGSFTFGCCRIMCRSQGTWDVDFDGSLWAVKSWKRLMDLGRSDILHTAMVSYARKIPLRTTHLSERSAGILPPSTEVANALAKKHPQDTPGSDVEYTLPPRN